MGRSSGFIDQGTCLSSDTGTIWPTRTVVPAQTSPTLQDGSEMAGWIGPFSLARRRSGEVEKGAKNPLGLRPSHAGSAYPPLQHRRLHAQWGPPLIPSPFLILLLPFFLAGPDGAYI